MANHGNTGQQYRMTKLVSIEVEADHIVLHLECEHDLTTKPMWCSIEQLAGILSKHIGKRRRCNKCEVVRTV